MDITNKQITDQRIWIKRYWDKLNAEYPYKCTTGKETAERFMFKEQAIRFFNQHQGRCLLSYYPPSGGVKFLKYKWYKFE